MPVLNVAYIYHTEHTRNGQKHASTKTLLQLAAIIPIYGYKDRNRAKVKPYRYDTIKTRMNVARYKLYFRLVAIWLQR